MRGVRPQVGAARAAWLGISLRCSGVVLGFGCGGAGGWRGAGLGVGPGREAGGPVALAVKGFGWAGGDFTTSACGVCGKESKLAALLVTVVSAVRARILASRSSRWAR
jgi:hypothetical protein